VRIGQGVDAHAFAPAGSSKRPLVLGGLEIAGGPALEGHSDADVVLHAVTDALLGAAALGDLGSRFGTGEPRYAGASSSVFAAEAVRWLVEAGWAVSNVDCTVVAERPRLAAHRDRMRASMARLLGVEFGAVSVKATTTDGLGWTGRGEGIACLAVALLRPDR